MPGSSCDAVMTATAPVRVKRCRCAASGETHECAVVAALMCAKSARAGALRHVLDMHALRHAGRMVVVMPDGGARCTLQHWLSRGDDDVTPQHVRSVVFALAWTLRELWLLGWAHLDVKPQNVLVSARFAPASALYEMHDTRWRTHACTRGLRLIDFDHSLRVDPRQRGCRVSGIRGSPAYLPPEYAHACDSGAQSVECDLWALGVVMLECALAVRSPLCEGRSRVCVAHGCHCHDRNPDSARVANYSTFSRLLGDFDARGTLLYSVNIASVVTAMQAAGGDDNDDVRHTAAYAHHMLSAYVLCNALSVATQQQQQPQQTRSTQGLAARLERASTPGLRARAAAVVQNGVLPALGADGAALLGCLLAWDPVTRLSVVQRLSHHRYFDALRVANASSRTKDAAASAARRRIITSV